MAVLRLLMSPQVLVIQKTGTEEEFHSLTKELILSIPPEDLKPLKRIILCPPLDIDGPSLTEEIVLQ